MSLLKLELPTTFNFIFDTFRFPNTKFHEITILILVTYQRFLQLTMPNLLVTQLQLYQFNLSTMFSISAVLFIIDVLYASTAFAIPPPDHTPISSRAAPMRAGVNITTFNDTSCGQDPIFQLLDQNLTYGVMLPLPFTAQSYNLSRYLSSEERPDWSAPYAPNTEPAGGMIPDKCGTYLQTTNPDSNGNTLHDGTCYLITGGATVCGLF